MKKWIILGGAVLTALVVSLYCTDPKFDNPLDKDGSNYLFGDPFYLANEKDMINDTSGRSGLFDPELLKTICDSTLPQITLVGGTANISTNDAGRIEYNRLMGNGTGKLDGVVTWTGKTVDARLIRGAEEVRYKYDSLPASGGYEIVYRTTRDTCKGKVPSAEIRRGLVIIEYIASDTAPPIVRLTGGQSIVTVNIDDSYTDGGVAAQEANGTAIPLDSITVKSENGGSVGISTITAATTQDALSQLNTQLTAKNKVAGKYIVTYYASSRINRKVASVSRTVEFKVGSSIGLPVPVIVLNKYTHSYGGKTIYHVDTALASGGSYREIGVNKVYYVRPSSGDTVIVPSDRVSRPNVTGTGSNAALPAQYSLPAMTNEYQATTATRYVYVWTAFCDPEKMTGPEIPAWRDGGDPLPLSLSSGSPAGTWDYIASWSVTGLDEEGNSRARKYLVDLGGLERSKPNGDRDNDNRAVLKPGTYTITYVGLGGCGGTVVKTRTLTVQ